MHITRILVFISFVLNRSMFDSFFCECHFTYLNERFEGNLLQMQGPLKEHHRAENEK